MCRWIAYSGQPVLLETLVCRPKHSLVRQSHAAAECKVNTNGDGFGVGWYGLWDEPGLYRDVLPAWSDENLQSLCRQISSPMFFAHVRASTGTGISRTNCHPFVNGPWMFMHNGQIGGWDRVRRAVEQAMPDRNYTLRRGTTDSEAMFLMLDEAQLTRDPIEAMDRVISRVLAMMAAAGVDEPLRFTAALSNGRALYAFRYASDAVPPTLYWRDRDGDVTVVSEPLDDERDGWTPLAPSTALAVVRGKAVAFRTFAPRIGTVLAA